MIGQLVRTTPLLIIMLGMVAWPATVPGSPAFASALARRVVRVTVPQPVSFDETDRGFIADVWINGTGPYAFAIDTGAGGTLVSESVAAAARLPQGQTITIAGLSGRQSSAREVPAVPISAGTAKNRLPSHTTITVSAQLPPGVDGLLDPAQAFWPLGFVIDVPKGMLSGFDPGASPLSQDLTTPEGTVTPWLLRDTARRPFVALDDGRTALIDTGSSLGLVLTDRQAREIGLRLEDAVSATRIRDAGGGSVEVRRASLRKIMLGSMVLENVPVDVVTGAGSGTPILLGRAVLRPFVLTFDPRSRLIRIEPR